MRPALKVIATQDIVTGDAVVFDDARARPAYQGEAPRAHAAEAIAKGELAIVDLASGVITRAPVRKA